MLIGEMLRDINGYSVINFNGEKAYVEGVEKLLAFSDEIVTLKCKKAIVYVEGSSLKVDEIDDGSVSISGKILHIRSERSGKIEEKSNDK